MAYSGSQSEESSENYEDPGDQSNTAQSITQPKRRKSGAKRRGRGRAFTSKKRYRAKQKLIKDAGTSKGPDNDNADCEQYSNTAGPGSKSTYSSLVKDAGTSKGPDYDNTDSELYSDTTGSKSTYSSALVDDISSGTSLPLQVAHLEDVSTQTIQAHCVEDSTQTSLADGKDVATQTLQANYVEDSTQTSLADGKDVATQTFPAPQVERSEANGQNPAETGISTPDGLLKKVNRSLPLAWLAYQEKNDICAMMMSSSGFTGTVQRSVFASLDGGRPKIFVHYVEITDGSLLQNIQCELPSSDHPGEFLEAFLEVINKVRMYSICCGGDEHRRFCDAWQSAEKTEVDRNIFQEQRYSETLRSASCVYLVPQKKRSCDSCQKLTGILRQRTRRRLSSGNRPVGPICHLTPRRLKTYARLKQKALEASRQKNRRLLERIDLLTQPDGVEVDQELHEDIKETLKGSKGLPKFFLEQQLLADSAKSSKGIRWHPAIIRLALHIRSISSSAYRAMRDSGFIQLPSERTLYEYSHAYKTQEGVNDHTVDFVLKKLEGCQEYQRYNCLSFDEIYICQNLVYNKGSGEILGFVNLSEVENEMAALDKEIQQELGGPAKPPPVATKMLAFMVKGICNDVKVVMASFSTNSMNTEVLRARSFQVLGRCERAGIFILAMVGDKASMNHAFFDSHTPATVTESGVVFDCWNYFAPGRKLFFVNDMPHLLKTFRNCIANSGAHKNSRLLVKNGQVITWKTIVRLYKDEEDSGVRMCHKLNANNVFLNNFSCMSTRDAAVVLSRTVATAIEMKGYRNTEELVRLIRYINDVFDCLNGAHSSQAGRCNNPLLAAYTDVNDERFEFLQDFLKYLKDWKTEVEETPSISTTGKAKRLLSVQTTDGIEWTINGFTGAVKFLLGLEKVSKDNSRPPQPIFVMPRAFQQDNLEQFFSRVRSHAGDWRNPDTGRYLASQHSIELQASLGFKARGNARPAEERISIDEPAPKRRKTKRSLQFVKDT